MNGTSVGKVTHATDVSSDHRPQLDSLRAFAVGAVLIEHFVPAADALAPFGIMGVRLFFVLSGFLITGILLRCKRLTEEAGGQTVWLTIRQFYVRRFLRIMPAFYVVILGTLAIETSAMWSVYRWHAAYATNAYIALWGEPPGGGLAFWTLAVEEQFYLIWPWVVILVPRRKLVMVIAGAIAVGPLFRAVGILSGYDAFRVGVFPIACLDTLGAGAMLAVLSESSTDDHDRRQHFVNAAFWIGVPSLAAQMMWYWHNPEGSIPHITLDLSLALCSVWLVAGATQGFNTLAGRILNARPVVYIGSISYGIYLYHGLAYSRRWTIANAVHSIAGSKGSVLIGLLAVILIVQSLRHPAARRRLIPLVPACCGAAATIIAAAVVFATARFKAIDMATMNAAIYVVIAVGATLVAASLSWELFERPVNRVKRLFPYANRAASPVAVLVSTVTT